MQAKVRGQGKASGFTRRPRVNKVSIPVGLHSYFQTWGQGA